MALATALFALITIALLVRAIVVPSLASRRAATRGARFHALESAAEARAAQLAGDATRETLTAMGVGQRVATREVDSTGAELVSELWRTSAGVWAVTVEGTILLETPAAVSRTVLLELRPDSAAPAPAVTAGGGASLVPGTTVAVDSACGAAPAVVEPPDPRSGDPVTYARPAGLRVADARQHPDIRLAAGTTIRPAPSASGGSCVAGPENWGSPGAGPCGVRRPVVVAEGDLDVLGGEGQGVLLVNGILRISGAFRFDGVIVAAGGILATGADVHIAGALFTSPSAVLSVTGPRARITGSGCVVAAAVTAAGRPAVVQDHGWFR